MASKLSSKQEHAVFLMQSLHGLKQTQGICDFTVEVGRKTFSVHRNVLAACSGYFGGMFTSRMRESDDGRVEMKDVTENAMEQCFNYMYTGEVEVTTENIYDVLRAADMIQLLGLRTLCIEYLEKNLTIENCLLTKAVARSLDLTESQKMADRFVHDHFEKVFTTHAFKALQLDEVLSYLKDMTGHSNQTKWNAGISWVEFDQENRTENLVVIMGALQVENFPFKFLYATMWRAESVQKSTACMALLKSALLKNLCRDNLTRSNCFEFLRLAKGNLKLCPDGTISAIRSYMVENFTTLIGENEFGQLDKNDIVSIYESLPQGNQEEKWETLLKWVKSDRKNRKQILPKLMGLIRIEYLTHEYIQSQIFSESLIKQSHECKDLVIQALLQKASPSKGSDNEILEEYETDSDNSMPEEPHPQSKTIALPPPLWTSSFEEEDANSMLSERDYDIFQLRSRFGNFGVQETEKAEEYFGDAEATATDSDTDSDDSPSGNTEVQVAKDHFGDPYQNSSAVPVATTSLYVRSAAPFIPIQRIPLRSRIMQSRLPKYVNNARQPTTSSYYFLFPSRLSSHQVQRQLDDELLKI